MNQTTLPLLVSFVFAAAGQPACVVARLRDDPVLHATFTTMGNFVVAPGRTTSCPPWFWESWTVSISANGSEQLEVTDGERVVLSRKRILAPDDLRNLLASVEQRMRGIPGEIGRPATDSDSGEITLIRHSRRSNIHARGAHEGAGEFVAFYKLVRYLESRLNVPDPYCR